jgi:hypothetical protein
MNFPITQNQALDQATRAYHNFERRQVPFAAIKLNIAAQRGNKQVCDEIVEDNYRSEKDVILKKSDAYVILMQDTTLEVAESATQRLKARLGQLRSYSNYSEQSNPIQASAYILGSSKGTQGLLMRYLDLSPELNFKPQVNISKPSFREYIKWLNAPEKDNLQVRQRINIKI